MQRYDVAIVGGGLAGLTLSLALKKLGLRVCISEKNKPNIAARSSTDGRAHALAHTSQMLYQDLGLWQSLQAYAQPFTAMQLFDPQGNQDKPLLSFDVAELGADAPKQLGHIIENQGFRAVLEETALNELGRDWYQGFDVDFRATDAPMQSLSLKSETQSLEIEAQLVVACDGRGSKLRKQAGLIGQTWSYDQEALVLEFEHDLPHGSIARQIFLKDGPLALLPLPASGDAPNRSSLVWSMKSGVSQGLMKLSDADLSQMLTSQVSGLLGEARVKGQRWAYPLSALQLQTLIQPGFVALGEAAHGLHPIAGQGLNLSLRDIESLAQHLSEARRVGASFGDFEILTAYQQSRRADTTAMLSVTDQLTKLHGAKLPGLSLVSGLGMKALDTMPRLKAPLMRHAMGLESLGA